jgi:hypothetical protein
MIDFQYFLKSLFISISSFALISQSAQAQQLDFRGEIPASKKHCFIDRMASRSIKDMLKDITAIDCYKPIRESFGNSKSTKHFPLDIPENATFKRFAFFPGLLQAGAYLELRLRLPPTEIESLYQTYSGIATHRYFGVAPEDPTQRNNLPSASFATDDRPNPSGKFPLSYEVLVIEAIPGQSGGWIWNHGDMYGVAIDKNASEIVYWMSHW